MITTDRGDKCKYYNIIHMKAEIRVLRDTSTNVKKYSKEALYQNVSMNNALNARLEIRYHLNT